MHVKEKRLWLKKDLPWSRWTTIGGLGKELGIMYTLVCLAYAFCLRF